jgi:hypothetical protein
MMKLRYLIPLVVVGLSLTLPVSVMGQEPPNSPIHSDGSCDIEGVVFSGVMDWTITLIPPSSPGGQRPEEPRWIEDGDFISLECVDGSLDLRLTFDDGSGETRYGETTGVLFSGGKVFRVTIDPPDWGEGFVTNPDRYLLQMELNDSHHFRLVDLNHLFTEESSFSLVRVSDKYQTLFSSPR